MTDNLNKGHKAFERDFGERQSLGSLITELYLSRSDEDRVLLAKCLSNKDNNHG